MDRGWFRKQLVWIVPLLLGVSALVFGLLLAGAKGAGVADALSLLVGSTSLVATVLAFQHSLRTTRTRDDDDTGGGESRRPRPGPLPFTRRLIAAVTTVALGVGGAILYFQVIQKPDIPVTDLVEI